MNKFLDELVVALLVALSFMLIVTALILSVCVILFVFEQNYRCALQYGVIAFALTVAGLALINIEGNR